MANLHNIFIIYMEKQPIKIKILYTIPNFDTAGSGKALLNVAKSLNSEKFEPYICCDHPRGLFFKNVKDSGIPIYLKKTRVVMIPRYKGIKETFYLAKYLKSLNVDIIHSFHYGDDYSEALAAKIAGIPWIYTKKNMNWGGKSKNSWILRTFFSKHILAQNTEMIKEFFPKSKKVTLVPRGVNTKEFFPSAPNKGILTKYRIQKLDKVITCVANLHPVKGVEILIDAFLQISKVLNSVHLFIIGFNDNEYGEFLKNKVNKSCKRTNIHFTGKVNNIKEFLSVSDLFVLPTLNIKRREGCPVALLEALACGLKVLGSNVCGINNILSDFPGNMFEAGNVVQLKEKIEEQLMKEDKIGDKLLLKHTIKNYDIMVEAKKHENVYLNIL